MHQDADPDHDRLLVTEIRHRMANAFQLLAALTRRQIKSCPSEIGQRHLTSVMEHIQTVAQIQACLGSADVRGFAAFLNETERLWKRLGEDRDIKVAFKKDAACPDIPTKMAGTLALAFQEGLTNCFEHAFSDEGSGNVTVLVDVDGENRLWLEIRDDGSGHSADDATDPGHQGTKLIRSLASSIGGEAFWSHPPDGGTSLKICAPLNE